MMNIDEKKKLALEVIARLKQAYPDAACSLQPFRPSSRKLSSLGLLGGGL